jgi:hypothetical protein
MKKEIIICIVGESVVKNGNTLGSSKDFEHRVKTIIESGYEVEIYSIISRSDILARKELKRIYNSGKEIYGIIFEHTRWPMSIRYASKIFKGAKIGIRSHNAEILHALDMFFAYTKSTPLYRYYFYDLISIVSKIIKSVYEEYSALYYADYIMVCNETEASYYKNLYFGNFSNKIKIVNTVFNIDVSRYRNESTSTIPFAKQKKIAFIGSFLPTYFNDHALKVLMEEFEYQEKEDILDVNNIKFTGNYGTIDIDRLPKNMQYLGVVKDPIKVMQDANIILFPSKYGRGIKTRIFEAVVLEKIIIVHIFQFNRLPKLFKKYVVPWDPKEIGLKRLLTSITHEYSSNNKKIENEINKYIQNSNASLIDSIKNNH